MKKIFLLLMLMMCAVSISAKNEPTVKVVYNGTTAEITIPDEVKDFVEVKSGTSSHVDITSSTESVEIIYDLSGSSDDGEFYLTGSYKCGIDLTGLTLTNPNGPALNIKNGKRIEISAKNGTTNTLTDGKNKNYNGCIHCTGHLEFKGKGELNIVGNYKHAIYSEEYTSIKNLTLNITSAKKDGIHCQEYFLMESGNVTISNTEDDGIQCALAGETSTGELADHEDEDTGNVYLLGGTLTIKGYGGEPIKADGSIEYSGTTCDFGTSTGISVASTSTSSNAIMYDLSGRRVANPSRGIYILNGKKITVK